MSRRQSTMVKLPTKTLSRILTPPRIFTPSICFQACRFHILSHRLVHGAICAKNYARCTRVGTYCTRVDELNSGAKKWFQVYATTRPITLISCAPLELSRQNP